MPETVPFRIGPITGTVLTTWAIMLVLFVTSWLSTRRLELEPSPWQTALEGIVATIEDAIAEVLPEHARQVMPVVATFWIFIVVANLVGLIPGVHGPTGDLSLTAALAIVVFLSVHYFGIRIHGLARYLHHYIEPNPVLLPFHVVSEISRTVALAVRLFGNIFSLELAALLVLLVGGLLVPVPLLLLHVVEALVQAYIFGMLALVYIAGGVQSLERSAGSQQE
jgi:F-type H+-transporting ATPase subunit a